jgi:WD40 repeat protein
LETQAPVVGAESEAMETLTLEPTVTNMLPTPTLVPTVELVPQTLTEDNIADVEVLHSINVGGGGWLDVASTQPILMAGYCYLKVPAGCRESGFRIYDYQQEKTLRVLGSYLASDTQPIGAISPDGKLAAYAKNGELIILDIGSNEEKNRVPTGWDEIRHIQFSYDGSLVAVLSDRIAVYEVSSGRLIKTFLGSTFAFSKSTNTFYLAGSTIQQYIYEENNHEFSLSKSLNLSPIDPHFLVIAPDDQFLALSWANERTDIWDFMSGERVLSIPKYFVATFLLDRNLIAVTTNEVDTSLDVIVQIWNYQTGNLAKELSLPSNGLHGIRNAYVSIDGKHLIFQHYNFDTDIVRFWGVLGEVSN